MQPPEKDSSEFKDLELQRLKIARDHLQRSNAELHKELDKQHDDVYKQAIEVRLMQLILLLLLQPQSFAMQLNLRCAPLQKHDVWRQG